MQNRVLLTETSLSGSQYKGAVDKVTRFRPKLSYCVHKYWRSEYVEVLAPLESK